MAELIEKSPGDWASVLRKLDTNYEIQFWAKCVSGRGDDFDIYCVFKESFI